jgi:hypothetical protein
MQSNLKNKGRFSYTGFSSEQNQASGYHSTAQDPVEFSIRSINPGQFQQINLIQCNRIRAILSGLPVRLTPGRERNFFLKGVPLTARCAMANPFWRGEPAILTDKGCFKFCQCIYTSLFVSVSGKIIAGLKVFASSKSMEA